jgi:hypothetical protein
LRMAYRHEIIDLFDQLAGVVVLPGDDAPPGVGCGSSLDCASIHDPLAL